MKKILVAIPHQQHSYHTFAAIGDDFEKTYMTTVYNSGTFFDRLLICILPSKFKSVYRDKRISSDEPCKIVRKNTFLGLIFLIAGHLLGNNSLYPIIMNIL